jgi:hypothetical protein
VITCGGVRRSRTVAMAASLLEAVPVRGHGASRPTASFTGGGPCRVPLSPLQAHDRHPRRAAFHPAHCAVVSGFRARLRLGAESVRQRSTSAAGRRRRRKIIRKRIWNTPARKDQRHRLPTLRSLVSLKQISRLVHFFRPFAFGWRLFQAARTCSICQGQHGSSGLSHYPIFARASFAQARMVGGASVGFM